MNRAFSADRLALHDCLGRCPRLIMNGAFGAKTAITGSAPTLPGKAAATSRSPPGCFPEAWCGTLAGSVSAKGAVSFKPGAAPQDFDSDEQALKARVNSIA